jgi:hypothetical protein
LHKLRGKEKTTTEEVPQFPGKKREPKGEGNSGCVNMVLDVIAVHNQIIIHFADFILRSLSVRKIKKECRILQAWVPMVMMSGVMPM